MLPVYAGAGVAGAGGGFGTAGGGRGIAGPGVLANGLTGGLVNPRFGCAGGGT